MIAIASHEGNVLKVINGQAGVYGFHAHFGWVSEASSEERLRARRRNGLRASSDAWRCKFRLDGKSAVAVEGCTIQKDSDQTWLDTSFGKFEILNREENPVVAIGGVEPAKDRTLIWTILGSAAFAILLVLLTRGAVSTVAPEIQPISIKMSTEKQKTVVVPTPNALTVHEVTPVAPPSTTKEVRRAVAQNLGFLGLLGQKNLTKAMGGVPTALKNASPGAGAGGKEGSGGELLVGLGQGVQRTTVGNSGVQGLGGIGTKGAGGGAGGYGNSLVGSGEGKGISAIAVSQDMVLDGGLSRSVIQATIAKYLSQVRSCYEQGLSRNQALTGQVSMAFEISGQGTVSSSRVANSTLGDAAVEQCISTKLKTWQFPKPVGGVNVKVNYPFLLRPVST